MLAKLFDIIQDRKLNPVSMSYTNALFDLGPDRIAQKVGEEAIELIIAARAQGKERTIEESGDLLYHLLVLWVDLGISVQDIETELAGWHKN